MADNGDQLAVAARLHPQHAEAVLGVVERHPLDEASEDLAIGCLTLVAQHAVRQDAPPFGQSCQLCARLTPPSIGEPSPH